MAESVMCSTGCGREADESCVYKKRLYCRPCAHNLTHSTQYVEGHIAVPVFDGATKELIPFGTYPNIDWT